MELAGIEYTQVVVDAVGLDVGFLAGFVQDIDITAVVLKHGHHSSSPFAVVLVVEVVDSDLDSMVSGSL